MKNTVVIICLLLLGVSCNEKKKEELKVQVYQSNAGGDLFKVLTNFNSPETIADTIRISPETKFQKIEGIGGAFTESSAYLLNQLSVEKRKEVLNAYFSDSGANYSLTRTHINSCDFSLSQYSYANTINDTQLIDFNIVPDLDDIIPMIIDAQKISKDGFKIIASPWTAPPWMKDNNDWNGGKLKPEFYPSWANYFSKYISAYKNEGIDIWAVTVENEPLGNDANWESMHYTPQEMRVFVKEHLGPLFKEKGLTQKVLVYDQNRGKELEEWAEELLTDSVLTSYIHGTAVHWYTSTNQVMEESLNFTHDLAPTKSIIHTEGCIDAEVPHWKEDKWYWSKEATDWGYDWAPEEDKKDHPKYVPVYRYARDIIGCLNNWVEGWVDWNMVLDKQGGPNSAKNWCTAPIIVDPEKDEVYYTPLYYTMMHFSKFIRPGAHRIQLDQTDKGLLTTAVQNKDGSIVIVVLNTSDQPKEMILELENKTQELQIAKEGLQTIVINKQNI